MELDVVVPFGTLRGHGEHVRADVHADDEALGPDRLEQLGDVEAGAAAHVEDAVAGSGAERSADQLAPAQHVARRVEPLQPLDEAPIELQLSSRRNLSPRAAAEPSELQVPHSFDENSFTTGRSRGWSSLA